MVATGEEKSYLMVATGVEKVRLHGRHLLQYMTIFW